MIFTSVASLTLTEQKKSLFLISCSIFSWQLLQQMLVSSCIVLYLSLEHRERGDVLHGQLPISYKKKDALPRPESSSVYNSLGTDLSRLTDAIILNHILSDCMVSQNNEKDFNVKKNASIKNRKFIYSINSK